MVYSSNIFLCLKQKIRPYFLPLKILEVAERSWMCKWLRAQRLDRYTLSRSGSKESYSGWIFKHPFVHPTKTLKVNLKFMLDLGIFILWIWTVEGTINHITCSSSLLSFSSDLPFFPSSTLVLKVYPLSYLPLYLVCVKTFGHFGLIFEGIFKRWHLFYSFVLNHYSKQLVNQ